MTGVTWSSQFNRLVYSLPNSHLWSLQWPLWPHNSCPDLPPRPPPPLSTHLSVEAGDWACRHWNITCDVSVWAVTSETCRRLTSSVSCTPLMSNLSNYCLPFIHFITFKKQIRFGKSETKCCQCAFIVSFLWWAAVFAVNHQRYVSKITRQAVTNLLHINI